MAHIALLNEENIVCAVHVVNNKDLPNNGAFSLETELFANQLQENLGIPGNWKLTSFNGNFRGVYAGIGYRYDPVLDRFIPPEDFDAFLAE
jgi:hypothetical protein